MRLATLAAAGVAALVLASTASAGPLDSFVDRHGLRAEPVHGLYGRPRR
jgi:hypothetical protein